ncbi:Sodium/glucose cotransporter [Polystyrenella longa]|uniref:Sodium/glucose cotransporter n=1 Tax=Polystyrenella longa TaxID=2528007 RepID=A0A518CRW8_9PLAN|nr:sodium:solute symporter [Polystyrenella longa]QDU81965.1 Sodium/glucose cotransporter [Polystyrenella longa]
MLSNIDLAVLIVYLGGMVAFGFWFARKSSSTEEFMAAGRSLPGWAVGLSIFGTFVSSISFLANPGKSFGGNWNPFVFGLSLPLAAFIAAKWFVPFYRKSGEVSAYSHLEHRFGVWARLYVVCCFLVLQIVRIGVIMMLAATPIRLMTGWDMSTIIIVIGILVTLYTLLGGIEAVIWTDVVQSVVLTGGAILCIILIMIDMPEGPGQIFDIAMNAEVDGKTVNKFSLGSFSPSLMVAAPTFWITLIYGLFINLNNFGIDQSFVQRYITAKTDKDATQSVWLGAWLFLPTSAMLFFIGTALYAYTQADTGFLEEAAHNVRAFDENVDADTAHEDVLKNDEVFPAFIAYRLPVGVKGILIAAIFAAAMSSIDSSLNSSATLILADFYKRFKNPNASERASMTVLYSTTLILGFIGTLLGLGLMGQDSMLDIWWKLSGILSGGMLGLFLLGIISKRAGNPAAILGVILGMIVIAWMTISSIIESLDKAIADPSSPSPFEFMRGIIEPIRIVETNMNGLMTIVFGTLTIVLSGMLFGLFFKKPQPIEPKNSIEASSEK